MLRGAAAVPGEGSEPLPGGVWGGSLFAILIMYLHTYTYISAHGTKTAKTLTRSTAQRGLADLLVVSHTL